MSIRLNDFDYPLPEELIAQHPTQKRDASRLMHLSRQRGVLGHYTFNELPSLLRAGDLLVINDTKVIPAKFFCRRGSGGRIEGLYLHSDKENRWEVLLKNTHRCKSGERLIFENFSQAAQGDNPTRIGLKLLENLDSGRWRIEPDQAGSAEEILQKVGAAPLPPYIKRPDTQTLSTEDQQRYQTVYATHPGAVAAPTAGLHFTDEILVELTEIGITTTRVTLHVGLGTFEPVKCEELSRHDMHVERFELSGDAASEITTAKSQGRRVVAVGTTSVRVLESIASRCGGQIQPECGQTNLFLYPPSDFHVVDALITNFHLPKSTLLMLVSSFCDPGGLNGIKKIFSAYAEAVREKYRFFSYGDAMLIE